MARAELTLARARNEYRAAVLDAALPSFSLSLSGSLYDDADTRLRLERGDFTSSLSAAWNLYDSASGPVRRIRTARLDYGQAELTYLIARQEEALKALSRFYALYSARGRVAAAKANLSSRERQYKDTNDQYQSGTRSRIEVMQSEGDKLQSELSLAQAETAGIKALMAFNELINADPVAPAEVEVSTAVPDITLPLPPSDAVKALESNFSLRRRRLALEKTKITTRNAVAAELPRLRLDASWQKSGLGVIGEPAYGGAGNPDYGLRASLSFPFGFFWAQNALEISRTRDSLSSAEADLRDAERALRTEVLTAQKEIELQVRSRDLLEFQVKTQKESTDNLLSEYSLGGANMLQLDTAQTKLLDSTNGRIAAINALDIALAGYRALLGERIWE
jgi:outer membrane protein TolC